MDFPAARGTHCANDGRPLPHPRLARAAGDTHALGAAQKRRQSILQRPRRADLRQRALEKLHARVAADALAREWPVAADALVATRLTKHIIFENAIGVAPMRNALERAFFHLPSVRVGQAIGFRPEEITVVGASLMRELPELFAKRNRHQLGRACRHQTVGVIVQNRPAGAVHGIIDLPKRRASSPEDERSHHRLLIGLEASIGVGIEREVAVPPAAVVALGHALGLARWRPILAR